MKVIWIRGKQQIRCNRPYVWFCLGVRGSGKSTLLEHIAQGYLAEGHVVCDLFSSRDGESLAWLRSPYAKDKRILLVCGDNVDVNSSFDTRKVSKLRLRDFEDYDIIISSSPLYSSVDNEFMSVNRIIDLLYKRLHYKRLVNLVVRECANLYYSRLRVSQNQLSAKAETTYLIRESRHLGLSMSMDTLKYTSVDIDLRVLTDFLLLKAQGSLGLPDQLEWLYSFFQPYWLRNCPVDSFFIMSRTGNLGLGNFPYHEWHKKEQEDIIRSVGLKIERGEEIHYAESRGTFKTIGDEEHLQILDLFMGKVSMGNIAKNLKRSRASIHGQIHAHDEAIDRSGFCPRCKRAKGKYDKTLTKER